MSDEIMLVFGEDGVAREYDDAWDITIHCESEEEQKAVLEKLNNSNQESQELSKNSPKLDKENAESVQNVSDSDLISRKEAIDALMDFDKKLRKINWYQYPHTEYECRGVDEAIVKIENVPSAQPEGWLEQNKNKILQAGMEGREIDFRIGGRLFAIREKAQ